MKRLSENGVILLQVTKAQSGTDAPLTVYFDGSCALCSLEIRHYASKADCCRIEFIDVSEKHITTYAGVSPDELMRRFHVRLADGTLVAGARAFVVTWNELPNWRWLAKIAQVPVVFFIMELLYDGFLRIRPSLSRLLKLLGAKPLNSQKSKR